MHQNR